MTRILVTGAGGFIGAHIVARFAADPAFDVVRVLHQFAPPGPRGMTTTKADLTNAEESGGLIRTWKPDIVVHAAGRAGVSEADIRRINEGAGRLLIENVAREAPRAHMIALGSAAEYGPPTDGQPMSEDHPCTPRSAYGRAKLAVTEDAMEHTRRGDIRATVLRLFNVVGPGVGKHLPLGAFFDRLIRSDRRHQRAVVQMGPTDFVRDFVAVDDVVRAVERVVTGSIAGEVINVCSGKGRTLRELLMQTAALAGIEVAIESSTGQAVTGDQPIIGDPGKCRALLGFVPSADLDAALLAAWMQVMPTSAKGNA
ncbi:MAG: NAD-dependent epimerase/dehydratase family protein [Xanthobacteraceae bacterium]